MRQALGKPRLIAPELVEIGDEVSVSYEESNGITKTLRGIIAKQVVTGRSRFLMTKEGGTIFSWEPGRRNKVKVTLYSREMVAGQTLFEWDEDLMRRIA